jgi:PTH2 family peptidyl-tRNA hydrolase
MLRKEMIKQVIVMRTDLNMRKGKIVAQGSHASMKVFFDRIKSTYCVDPTEGAHTFNIPEEFQRYFVTSMELTGEMYSWMKGTFTKICVRVNSEEELHTIYKKAIDAGIPSAIIQDSGKTEFNGVPTYTCCAIGPDEAEKIDEITGELKLL